MKLIKKASVVALSVLAMNVAQAEREYKETGSIQCYKDDTTTDKDTVILFVNGISNHLDDAESSRQKLSEVYGCQKCDFRKSYNQTDGFLDDTHELIYGSDLQNQAIKFAGIQALLKVYIRNTQTINLYQNQFQDEDKVIEVFGHKTTLKRLKEINLFVYNTIVQQQQTANKASFFYDPRRNGTDFDKALNDFINKISQPTAFAKSEFKAYHCPIKKCD